MNLTVTVTDLNADQFKSHGRVWARTAKQAAIRLNRKGREAKKGDPDIYVIDTGLGKEERKTLGDLGIEVVALDKSTGNVSLDVLHTLGKLLERPDCLYLYWNAAYEFPTEEYDEIVRPVATGFVCFPDPLLEIELVVKPLASIDARVRFGSLLEQLGLRTREALVGSSFYCGGQGQWRHFLGWLRAVVGMGLIPNDGDVLPLATNLYDHYFRQTHVFSSPPRRRS